MNISESKKISAEKMIPSTLLRLETVAKKVDWPKILLLIKIHNFNPIIMKIGENDKLMSW